MVKLIFYKGRGNLFDWLVRLWTMSKYSHVELWHDGYSYTASAKHNVVQRFVMANVDSKLWDTVEVNADPKEVLNFFENTMGARYDWTGIFLHEMVPIKQHSKSKWYCSEWCAAAIGVTYPQMSPQQLYDRYDKSL